MQNQRRQLAAILFTDIVGYTALMQENEQKAVALIKHYNAALNRIVDLHNGKVLNYYGDGSLCTFPSVTEALNCAIGLQKELQSEPNVPLRIGLHVGEVFFEDKKALGDGVNVASRIQSLGQANTILFSKEIFDKIRNQPEFKSVSLGLFDFKNVDQPVEVFALANEGLSIPKRETMEGKLKPGLSKTNKAVRKKIIIAAAIGLLLVTAFFIYSMLFKKTGFTGKEKSIAVLPFNNMSSDKENEYFSDGMTEEITTQLSKIADLKVIARTSAMVYKGSKKSIRQIAEELGVASVLEGSVQKIGNDIRITAQLIDAHTQEHIWAEKYDREFKEVFAIQSEVAKEIAYQLNAKLTKEEKKRIEKAPTDNPKAYEYYLQGYQLHEKFFETLKPEYFENSEAFFKKALDLDSNYALALAALADLRNTYTGFFPGKKDRLNTAPGKGNQ
jgi:adenylate cyclase